MAGVGLKISSGTTQRIAQARRRADEQQSITRREEIDEETPLLTFLVPNTYLSRPQAENKLQSLPSWERDLFEKNNDSCNREVAASSSFLDNYAQLCNIICNVTEGGFSPTLNFEAWPGSGIRNAHKPHSLMTVVSNSI